MRKEKERSFPRKSFSLAVVSLFKEPAFTDEFCHTHLTIKYTEEYGEFMGQVFNFDMWDYAPDSTFRISHLIFENRQLQIINIASPNE